MGDHPDIRHLCPEVPGERRGINPQLPDYLMVHQGSFRFYHKLAADEEGDIDNASEPATTDGLDDLEALNARPDNDPPFADDTESEVEIDEELNDETESHPASTDGLDDLEALEALEVADDMDVDSTSTQSHRGWTPINLSPTFKPLVFEHFVPPTNRKSPTLPKRNTAPASIDKKYEKRGKVQHKLNFGLATSTDASSFGVIDYRDRTAAAEPKSRKPRSKNPRPYHVWDEDEIDALEAFTSQTEWKQARAAERVRMHNQWLADQGREYTRTYPAILAILKKQEGKEDLQEEGKEEEEETVA